jgi:hypothetical protein
VAFTAAPGLPFARPAPVVIARIPRILTAIYTGCIPAEPDFVSPGERIVLDEGPALRGAAQAADPLESGEHVSQALVVYAQTGADLGPWQRVWALAGSPAFLFNT